LDLLLAQPRVDRRRVCMTGLSGGGWQTIVLAALDTRITHVVPVAGYTATRTRVDYDQDLGDLEQTPVDLTTVIDYQTMTAMLAPRPTLLLMNQNDDCCFATPRTRPVIYNAVRPTFTAMGAADDFAWYSNRDPGTHNYDADNRSQLYRFLNRHFKLDSPEHDLHTPAEILPEPDLNVGLPANQQTCTALADARAAALCQQHTPVRTGAQRQALRREVAEVIRLPRYQARGRRVSGKGKVSLHVVKAGPWTLPVAVSLPRQADRVDLVITDGGRRAVGATPPGPRTACLAADVVGCLRDGVVSHRWRLVDGTGARLLGEMVAQILALADYARKLTGAKRINLHGYGLNSSVATLIAAGQKPGGFESLTCQGAIASLRRLIDWPANFAEAQGLFCFGLLEVADIPQLRQLAHGVRYSTPDRAAPDDPSR